MEKFTKSIIVIVLILLGIIASILVLQYLSTKNDLLEIRKSEQTLHKEIKKIQEDLIINNNSKDSIIALQKKLIKENIKLKKRAIKSENNLKYIKGKYKALTIDSNLAILKKRYEMDSINNAEY